MMFLSTKRYVCIGQNIPKGEEDYTLDDGGSRDILVPADGTC